ncbi:TPA: hypothetical protein DCP81_00190 [Candidatus Azambacteria bacterium]|nr:hypothetical protein [Candidatus Azambacteria bacterium]
MKNPYFPQLSDYPAGMLTPKKNASYAKIVESSGPAYFYKNPIARFLFKRRLKKALKMLGADKSVAALDAGTGVGYFLPALAARFQRVDAIDYHRESIECAEFMIKRKNIGNVHLMVGDILKMPYADNAFDAVVCLSALEHIENLQEALIEMKRVLKPDGILLVGYPMENLLMRFFLWLDRRTFFKKYEPIFAGSVAKGEVMGHVSSWRQIDQCLEKVFYVTKKDYIAAAPFFGRIYALRLAKRYVE